MSGWNPALRGLLLVFVLGCASPGPPHPPSLRLPEPATGLAAQRVGGVVRVSWTSPLNTTDGDRITGATTAIVCRELVPRGGCVPVQKLAAVAGPSSVADELPADLSSGPFRLLVYRVELRNAKGRSAGASEPVFAAAGAAPPAVGPLMISSRRNAVLVRWPSVIAPAAALMELKRSLTATAEGPVRPAGAAGGATAKRDGSLRGSKPSVGEAILRSPARADLGVAADGVLDGTVSDADTYTYVAQWVMDVTVSGHALELRGLPSPAASFTFRDAFPPQAPAGLVAVPGGGLGAPLSIDLSWEPNAEMDVAGYRVYRRTGRGEFVRIGPGLVRVPAYRDLKVDAGVTYSYRVTAVDERGNESGPGVEVQERPRP